MENKREKAKGITLIALVITIIVLLILAAITISTLTGENGILTRATKAKEEHKIADAREKLSLVLLDAGIEKRTNIKYNQDAFLDEFITTNLEGSKIRGDIAIVDGYAFELDRSVPKIGQYVGKEKDLIFPDLKLDTQINEKKDAATITITTQEKTNGITKIEVILNGDVIHTFDNYDNTKEEVTEKYTTDKNGTYIIKVYSKLTSTEITKVEELLSTIIYEPNGSEQYAKEFQVKVSVSEANEKVKSIKYQWTDSNVEPSKESFTESIGNGGTVRKDGLTGKWYLWTLLETQSGTTRTGKSEAFHFDNTGPEVTLTSMPVSESSFTLTAQATDTDVKTIAKYEFYVDGTLVNTQTTAEGTASYTVTGVEMGTKNCYVKVYDVLTNSSVSSSISSRTLLYTWETWSVNKVKTYKSITKGGPSLVEWKDHTTKVGLITSYQFNTSNGSYFGTIPTTFKNACALSLGDMYAAPSYSGLSENGGRWYSQIRRVNEVDSNHEIYPGRTSIRYDFLSSDIDSIYYSKGTRKYDDTTSTSSTAYPNNDRSGEYWYVYKGLQ